MNIYEVRAENLRHLVSLFPKAQDFADLAGTSAVYVSQICSTKTKANMGNSLSIKICAALGLPVGFLDVEHSAEDWVRLVGLNLDWLDEPSVRRRAAKLEFFDSESDKELFESGREKGGGIMMKSSYLIRPDMLEYVPLDGGIVPARKVPVVSYIQGGDEGFFVDFDHPTGFGDGYLPHFTKDQNAYALRVKGDSMSPRVRSGEYIVVEPNREPSPGDEVVAKLADGRRMVKVLLFRRNGEVTLGSVNEEHKPITVQESDIIDMHYVGAVMRSASFIHD